MALPEEDRARLRAELQQEIIDATVSRTPYGQVTTNTPLTGTYTQPFLPGLQVPEQNLEQQIDGISREVTEAAQAVSHWRHTMRETQEQLISAEQRFQKLSEMLTNLLIKHQQAGNSVSGR
jgi:chromosome segregation ATPase